jgi:hypothetical protein
MARYSGSGWHNQSTRHSNAKRTGHAGGTYLTINAKTPMQADAVFDRLKKKGANDMFLYNWGTGKRITLKNTKHNKQIVENLQGIKKSRNGFSRPKIEKQQNSFSRVNKELRDVNKNSTFDLMMKWESEPTTPAEDMILFGRLIKNGQAWTLQGTYGRQAQTYIDSGVLDTKGNITQKGKEFIRDEY